MVIFTLLELMGVTRINPEQTFSLPNPTQVQQDRFLPVESAEKGEKTLPAEVDAQSIQNHP